MAKKAVLPLGSITLGGRISIMSEVALEKALEESKKKKKDKERFRLIDESDVEKVNMVSENEEEEGEEDEEEVPLQQKGKKNDELSSVTPKEKSSKNRKAVVSDPKMKGTSSKQRKKTQKKVPIVGREEWFAGLIMLRGRLIYPAVVTVF